MAATTVHAVADSRDLAPVTVAACQSNFDLATLTEELMQFGWVPTVPADLDDRAIRSYAGTFLVNQFSFGDYPDPRIASTWKSALKNAAGARNLKIIEDSRRKDRWFVFERSGSVLRIDSIESEFYSEVDCLLALKDEDSPFTFKHLLGNSKRDPKTLPLVYHLRTQSFEESGQIRRLNGTVLNTVRISAATKAGIDVSSVYKAFASKQRERSK